MSEFYEYDKALSKINDLEHENFLLKARIAELKARIAELEAESERFTAHSDIERQDDKWIPEVK